MRNLKIFICIIVILSIFIWYYNQDSKDSINTESKMKVVVSEEESLRIDEVSEKIKHDFEDCLKLVGLTKEKLLNEFDEKPISLDEKFESFSRETFGLGFDKSKIRVWFGDYGKGLVDQVYIYNKDIDINGSKVGDKISSFKKAFGKPLNVEEFSPYMNFEYNNKLLSIYYNLKTEETYGVYIMDKSGYSSEFIEHKNNRYAVCGIKDPIKFEKTFNTLKELVAKDKKEKVAEYVLYPINVYNDENGTKLEIKNKEDFIKNYDKIFNKKVKEAFINQNVKETFVNYQGVMVNNGEIWFGVKYANNLDTEEYGIIAINN